MKRVEIEFEEVIPSKEQIKTLFNLLNKRIHTISCKATDYIEHEKFVNTHPYRCWFLIKFKSSYVGNFYLSNENTVGINVSDECAQEAILPIVEFVRKTYQPLPPIPSVRGEKFAINVPPTYTVLTETLEKNWCKSGANHLFHSRLNFLQIKQKLHLELLSERMNLLKACLKLDVDKAFCQLSLQ